MDYRWSLGTLIGLPAAVLGCIALVVLIWFFRRAERNERGKSSFNMAGEAKTAWIACAVGLLLAIGGIAWGMWPYSSEYHQWRTESGVVTQVDSRLLGANRSTTQRFVVTLDGDRQRSCDDTRCAQLEVGDTVTLSCKRAWQWAGSHGYDCNFVGLKRGDGQ